MSHTLQPKLLDNWLKSGVACILSDICELHHTIDSGDNISPCSRFDHCERKATIWLYSGDAHWVYGYCNTCYNWCYPTKEEWYRVVKIAEDFTGVL